MPVCASPYRREPKPLRKRQLKLVAYRNVKNLTRDPVGNWAAEAERGGVEIAVVLQVNGEIAEE